VKKHAAEVANVYHNYTNLLELSFVLICYFIRPIALPGGLVTTWCQKRRLQQQQQRR